MHCNKKTRMSLDNEVKHFDNAEQKYKRKSYSPPPDDDGTDDTESTALHVAAKYNNLELLKGLLNSGHDADVKDSSGMTPLLLAVSFNHFDAVKLLLEKNADVFVTDSSNRSVLEILLNKASVPVNIVARLLNTLMKCNLDAAAKAGILVRANCELKIVLYLKDARATEEFLKRKRFISDEESAGAVEFAMDRLELENVRVLLQCGRGVDARREVFFRKLFDFCITGERRNLQSAKVFLERLNAWNLIVEDALDDFYLLYSIGDKNIIELLLQCNVNVYFKQKLGCDLVAHVFENRNVDAAELLRDRDFDANAKGEGGCSALHFTVRGDSERNVRFLLDLGADIDVKNESGRTPLLEAVAYDRKRIVEVLLQYGADIRAVVHDKFTVFDPFEKSFCTIMQEFFIAQLSINEVTGMPIEQSIRDRINSNRRCKTFYKQCRRQIEEMQRIKISKSFTLFTAVAGEIEEIARYVRDEETTQLLENYCRQRKIHSFYYSTVRHKLEKAKAMNLPTKCNFTMIISEACGSFVDFNGLMVNDIDVHAVHDDDMLLS